MSLVLEVAYRSTFSLEGYIAQLRYRGKCPGLSLKWSVRLYWLVMGSLTLSKDWKEDRVGGGKGVEMEIAMWNEKKKFLTEKKKYKNKKGKVKWHKPILHSKAWNWFSSNFNKNIFQDKYLLFHLLFWQRESIDFYLYTHHNWYIRGRNRGVYYIGRLKQNRCLLPNTYNVHPEYTALGKFL